LTSIAEPEEVSTEYLHYRQFFVIWEILDRVVEYQAEESTMAVHGATRETKMAWVAEYRVSYLWRSVAHRPVLTMSCQGFDRPSS
jgi:nuclear pore complex protein Nup107